MRTTTPAVDTRPSFFAFRPFRRASVVANILREKFGPGDEAKLFTAQHILVKQVPVPRSSYLQEFVQQTT